MQTMYDCGWDDGTRFVLNLAVKNIRNRQDLDERSKKEVIKTLKRLEYEYE